MLSSAATAPRHREPTIFFFEGERPTRSERRSRLAGFRALLLGGVLIALLTVILHPATDRTGCSNYGGNGNGTAFSDDRWDLFYPLILLLWLSTVIVEQFLPSTRSGRGTGWTVARGFLAIMLTISTCCVAELKVLALCH
ncbi:hypothetical protein [Actinoplanes sp. NPDC051851]|uniref:hypothetical protein n=1 Tax=Actinoplanes sp. NPDC051851 TaxID=3154753 RepID=UPI00344064D3